MTNITYIPGEIANAAIDEQGNRKPVTRTHNIFDDNKNKNQAEVNVDIDNSLNQLSNEIDAVNKQDIIPVDALPDVTTADPKKIYRVVGEDNYTDYMINSSGNDWKKLATYSFPGIDDEPTTGSDNLVKSGGVANKISKLVEKTSEITKDAINTEKDSISIEDNNGNEVFYLDENGLDAKNVKSNGKDVLTEHQDISGLATKEEVANKQDTIQEVSKEETNDDIKEIVFYDDEKTKILHRISEDGADFHNLKSDGKNVMLNGISTYFLEEMNDTITKIDALTQDLCYVMPILSDSHICNTNIDRKRSDESIRNVCYLNEHCYCNSVAHLGDLIHQDYFNIDEYTIEDASKFGYALIQDYLLSLAKSNEHFYATPGNHDGTYNSKQFKSFNLPKWNSMIGRKLALDNSIVMSNEKSYFYVDCNNVKLRLIFLSIPDYKTLAYMGISQGQLEWFAQEALNIDNDWNIIILSHVPLCGEDIVGNTKLVPSLTGVCNAFNNKNSFSDSYINVNYSTSNGKIIACIAGHWHEDIVKAPNEEWDIFGNHYKNEMPCVSIILASTYIAGHNNGGITRTYGTYSQDLWSTLVYKPNEKKIYFVRFGAGLDFYVDYNNNTYKIENYEN